MSESIRIYKDAALTQPLDVAGGSVLDEDTYNGTSGEAKEAQLWLANEVSWLDGGIDASVTSIAIDPAAFTNDDVILIDSEQMRVVSGGGTVSLTVQRAYNGTSAATHTDGTIVYAAYDFNTVVITPTDSSGTDESTWVRLATTQVGLSSAVDGAALSVGTKACATSYTFWRRITVPAATAVQNKVDLSYVISGLKVLV